MGTLALGRVVITFLFFFFFSFFGVDEYAFVGWIWYALCFYYWTIFINELTQWDTYIYQIGYNEEAVRYEEGTTYTKNYNLNGLDGLMANPNLTWIKK